MRLFLALFALPPMLPAAAAQLQSGADALVAAAMSCAAGEPLTINVTAQLDPITVGVSVSAAPSLVWLTDEEGDIVALQEDPPAHSTLRWPAHSRATYGTRAGNIHRQLGQLCYVGGQAVLEAFGGDRRVTRATTQPTRARRHRRP
mmetsp:Transcript_36081/g.105605  ORF Transcript_36081/g.105605 Transcript_36081/m.105605 type:complete len:146 (-) Transcript_36081:247-684(-)